MKNYKKLEEIKDLFLYISVEKELPMKDGMYDVIMHCGSMSIYFQKAQQFFRKGKFQRHDWNYVIYWKYITNEK